MTFKSGDDVLIISLIDTGEVVAPKPHPIYEVFRDADSTQHDHHYDDLEGMPCTRRKYLDGYYKILKARRGKSGRELKVTCYTNSGSKIYTV